MELISSCRRVVQPSRQKKKSEDASQNEVNRTQESNKDNA